MMNMCEGNRCLVTITRRIQKHTQVMEILLPCIIGDITRKSDNNYLREPLRGGISRRLAIVTLKIVTLTIVTLTMGACTESYSLLPPTTLLVHGDALL
jgi:hypothetical protein